MSETIDAEVVKPAEQQQTQALAVRETGGAVGRALTLEELHDRLEYVRQVMRQEMKEGQDYGKIPGTGDKPSLLQPGAQKLLMTFNLREQVKKEVLREFPSLPLHREYEFIVTVFPSGSTPENGWDGVGTCSTLESKYRYRKAERKCPQCGKAHIIVGKEEYGGGFLCWKKKGGCGAKFEANDQRITSQPADDVENEDPADCWNTCRKMAFKRALVAAAINATNTSELWTQDVEDMVGNKGKSPGRASGAPPATTIRPPTQTQRQAPAAATVPPASKPAQAPKTFPFPTADMRAKMISNIPEALLARALEYFIEIGALMDNEKLEDLELRFVPNRKGLMDFLLKKIRDYDSGAKAVAAFEPHQELEPPAKEKTARARKPAATAPNPKDPEWWRDVIVTVPPKGMKRAEYMPNRDTIGALYDRTKGGDQDAQRRLWGFVGHYDPQPWTGADGQVRQPSKEDVLFREGLDAFKDWHDKNGKDIAAAPDAPTDPGSQSNPDYEESEDVPF